MVDRFGNLIRHHTASASQNDREIYHDGPTGLRPGWTVDGVEYLETQSNGTWSRSNDIVTRAHGYVPYQSILERDGRHAYNPDARQYPRNRWSEIGSRRIAETPADRHNAWVRSRPSHLPPGATTPWHVYGIANSDGGTGRLQYPPMTGGLDQPVRMQGLGPPDPRVYAAQPSPWDAYGNAGGGMQEAGGGYGGFGGGYGTR